MQRVLHVLTGPTAVGKTEWALRWAERHDAEIVSCDSLLFYRGMDIGTAKPTSAELARVPHHLIDICDVRDQMNVTYYVSKARSAVEEIAARGKRVLVTGGSGFYLKAFFGPVADEIAVPEAVRGEVRALTLDDAVARLRALNSEGLGGLDIANPRRVTRALERCLASGRKLAELADEFSRRPSAFAEWRVELTRLEREPEDLAERITRRVAEMLRAGLIEEVRRLRAAGIAENPSAAKAIGYREVLARLAAGETINEAEVAAEIAQNTRALVKKQRTWFRTQLPEHRAIAAGELREVEQLFGAGASGA